MAPGLLDEHVARFDELVAAYPWHPSTFVSSHNDPNQFNVTYDGDRLWLIDWETSTRNDRFVDLAVLANHDGAVRRGHRRRVAQGWRGHHDPHLRKAHAPVVPRQHSFGPSRGVA